MPPSHTETYPTTDPAFLEDPYPVYYRMRSTTPCTGRTPWDTGY